MKNRSESFLLTDLYQLAMMEIYIANRETETAVFEFFARLLPDRRNCFMAAGLEQVRRLLERLHVPVEELGWSKVSGGFGESFLDYLSGFSFTGDVYAMPDSQYVDSRIIDIPPFQTVIASQAAHGHRSGRMRSETTVAGKRAVFSRPMMTTTKARP